MDVDWKLSLFVFLFGIPGKIAFAIDLLVRILLEQSDSIKLMHVDT